MPQAYCNDVNGNGGEHSQWNYQQTMFANAGTSGFWSNPITYDIGGQMYNPQMQYYTPPAWESWAQRGAGLVAATAFTLASGGLAAPAAWAAVGGMWAGAAVGAGVGAGIAYAEGWDVNRGAGMGADVGSILGAFAPGMVGSGAHLYSMARGMVARGIAAESEVSSYSIVSRRSIGDWLRFRSDVGGITEATGYGTPYTGKLGVLNHLGLRQGYSTSVTNLDSAGSWFARMDTAVHEGFHAFVGKYLPSVWKLGDAQIARLPIGAPVKYIEEVAAYTLGHGGALRFHAIPFAPLEAFGSLSVAESVTTIGVGFAGYGAYRYLSD